MYAIRSYYVIHGAIEHLHWPFILFFVFYFFPWCWFVGSALVNATGVAGRELLQLAGIPASKSSVGIIHAVAAIIP